MGERLAQGNTALALLANSLTGGFPRGDVAPYAAAQIAGALAGVSAAHAMFDVPLFQLSQAPPFPATQAKRGRHRSG